MLTVILGIILGAFIYYFIIKPKNFWAERNVTHVTSWPIVGNMWDFVVKKKHFYQITDEIYKKFPNDRYVGYTQFGTPLLLIRDVDLIKQIGVKEFESFHDHESFAGIKSDPLLSKVLLRLEGDKWKQMRATLSPAFTSSKMRNMYQLMSECAENFVEYFQGREHEDIEMKDFSTRFANDVIASTAFGIQVNAVEDPKHEFYKMGLKLTQISIGDFIKVFMMQISSTLAKLLKMRMIKEDVGNFFSSIIMNNIKNRLENKITRPDLIHLLLEAQKGKLVHDTHEEKKEGFATVEESTIGKQTKQMELTDADIVAQAVLFFFAGFDTVSTGISFMALELAVNPKVQKTLQEEIDSVRQKFDGKVPYDALLSMKYLDQVVSETLRKWPPAFQTDRVCRKEFTIPPTKPNERTIVVEKGTVAMIPIMTLHYDPKYFPEPERFNPERFSDENKANIVPGTYLPFGIGPRNCIGSRFALLEMKTLFFHLLSKFDLVANSKTEIPIKISPKKVNLAPENGFHLGLNPRQI